MSLVNGNPTPLESLNRSGGTMTGSIKVDTSKVGSAIKSDSDTNDLVLGDEVGGGGSNIKISGKLRDSDSGNVEIRAENAEKWSSIKQTPGGNIELSNKNNTASVINAVNGIRINTGNSRRIELSSTGVGNWITNDRDSCTLELWSGHDWSTGGFVKLYGKDFTSSPSLQGCVELHPHNGTNACTLVCYPDGRVVWQGENVIVPNDKSVSGTWWGLHGAMGVDYGKVGGASGNTGFTIFGVSGWKNAYLFSQQNVVRVYWTDTATSITNLHGSIPGLTATISSGNVTVRYNNTEMLWLIQSGFARMVIYA